MIWDRDIHWAPIDIELDIIPVDEHINVCSEKISYFIYIFINVVFNTLWLNGFEWLNK